MQPPFVSVPVLIPCPAAVLSLLSLLSLPLVTAATQGLTYDRAQAAINGTVSIQLPRWLEVLLHHSNHHLPSHLSLSIPSYNLPAAQVRQRQTAAGVSASCVACTGLLVVSRHSGASSVSLLLDGCAS
jgi:fatty acid desaturase